MMAVLNSEQSFLLPHPNANGTLTSLHIGVILAFIRSSLLLSNDDVYNLLMKQL